MIFIIAVIIAEVIIRLIYKNRTRTTSAYLVIIISIVVSNFSFFNVKQQMVDDYEEDCTDAINTYIVNKHTSGTDNSEDWDKLIKQLNEFEENKSASLKIAKFLGPILDVVYFFTDVNSSSIEITNDKLYLPEYFDYNTHIINK